MADRCDKNILLLLGMDQVITRAVQQAGVAMQTLQTLEAQSLKAVQQCHLQCQNQERHHQMPVHQHLGFYTQGDLATPKCIEVQGQNDRCCANDPGMAMAHGALDHCRQTSPGQPAQHGRKNTAAGPGQRQCLQQQCPLRELHQAMQGVSAPAQCQHQGIDQESEHMQHSTFCVSHAPGHECKRCIGQRQYAQVAEEQLVALTTQGDG